MGEEEKQRRKGCPGGQITIFFPFFFFLFRAAPMAYRISRARSLIGAVATGLCNRHSNPRSEPAFYTEDHSNSGSLTHCVRPRIEPTPSCILVRLVTTEPQWELQVPADFPSNRPTSAEGSHLENPDTDRDKSDCKGITGSVCLKTSLPYGTACTHCFMLIAMGCNSPNLRDTPQPGDISWERLFWAGH